MRSVDRNVVMRRKTVYERYEGLSDLCRQDGSNITLRGVLKTLAR